MKLVDLRHLEELNLEFNSYDELCEYYKQFSESYNKRAEKNAWSLAEYPFTLKKAGPKAQVKNQIKVKSGFTKAILQRILNLHSYSNFLMMVGAWVVHNG